MILTALVGAAACADYSPAAVDQAVRLAVERSGGWPAAIGPGRRVLVKPNLLLPLPPERAVTTHPAVLAAVIRCVRESGAEPFVAEEPGMLPLAQTRLAFQVTGTAQVCADLGVKLLRFHDRGHARVVVPGADPPRELFIARDVLEADAVISVAKAKTHVQATYTGAIKNMFGALPYSERKRLHTLARYADFSMALSDLLAAAPPTFAVMDAIVGMGGRGPSGGDIEKIGFVLAGSDCVAVDRATLGLMGLGKLRVLHLEYAAARGLGQADPERIKLVGASIETDAARLKPPLTWFRNMPPLVYRMFYSMMYVRPWIDPELCQRCGACAKACPIECISYEPKPAIDAQRCIECFCCHEHCPHNAISEKLGLINRIERRIRG